MRNVSIEFRSNDTAKLRPIPDVSSAYASDNLTSPLSYVLRAVIRPISFPAIREAGTIQTAICDNCNIVL